MNGHIDDGFKSTLRNSAYHKMLFFQWWIRKQDTILHGQLENSSNSFANIVSAVEEIVNNNYTIQEIESAIDTLKPSSSPRLLPLITITVLASMWCWTICLAHGSLLDYKCNIYWYKFSVNLFWLIWQSKLSGSDISHLKWWNTGSVGIIIWFLKLSFDTE